MQRLTEKKQPAPDYSKILRPLIVPFALIQTSVSDKIWLLNL